MAFTNFARSLEAVLKHEGGYVNHPKDPGGATNRGVTQAVYDAFRDKQRVPRRSVKDISNVEVAEIYATQYWRVIRGDELPIGLDYALFDAAVNSGPQQAVKWLQRALNAAGAKPALDVDGWCGAKTIAAIANSPRGVTKLINDLCDRRMVFLKALKTWPTFGKGWTRRVDEVRTVAVRMATAATAADTVRPGAAPLTVALNDAMALDTPTVAPEKALVADAPTVSSTPADAVVGVGAAIGAVALVVQQVQEALLPLALGSSTVGSVVAGLGVVGVVLTAAGAVASAVARIRAGRLAEALEGGPVP